MPGVHLHRSNRLERLVDDLAELASSPVAGPLAKETIVVPSKGLERWLAMELSRRLGVWARPDFPFPRAFVDDLLARALDAKPGAGGFSRADLGWAIAARLPALLALPAFAELEGYLAGDRDGAKLFALASRIAGVFDQYPVYRPDVVLGWERGVDRSWQAVLFREVAPPLGASHVARRAAELATRLREGRPLGALPARVSIVGAPSLPPIYLDVLAAIATRVDVHLFVVSPSREHWAEIRSKREIARALRESEASEDALSLTEGNPLLASLGRVGRDGQFSIEARLDYLEHGDLYVDPAGASALAVIQRDVLALVHRRAASPEARPLALSPGDRSISFHACHGPMREIEVVRDRILAMLDEDATLAPRDIVVMAPDIERHAPFIEAVFGRDPSDPTYVPYRVADRGVRSESEVAAAFFALLSVAGGRLGASEVLDLLGHAAVRARFGVVEGDLDLVRAWLAELSVSWGEDAAHRASVGQPATHETTWRFGLDRLLLGMAMEGRGSATFGGALPFDDVEGEAAVLAGRLAELVETIAALGERLRAQRAVASWRTLLEDALARTIDVRGPFALEHEAVRAALAAIAESAARAGHEGAVPLAVIVTLLEERLAEEAKLHGFLSGGVTFCALLPLRSIPFRVVCLVGMDDDAFPRSAHPPSFDLLAAHPRRGDRSMRDDDRYLFLEAILSARERLLVTYVGQTAKEGTVVPPSVVVSELLDVLRESFFVAGDEGGDAVAARLVTRHPMQPFSPRYFRGGGEDGLFSYSRSNADGARALAGARRTTRPLFEAPLATPEPPPIVELDELARFFAAPLRDLLRDRLALLLQDEVAPLDDREPMDLVGLARYGLGTDLALRALAGEDLPSRLHLARAGGKLPLGAPGARAFDALADTALAFASVVREQRAEGRREPIRVDLALAGVRLVGSLDDLYGSRQVQIRFGGQKAASELRLWVHHLALLAAGGAGDPRTSVLVERRKDEVVIRTHAEVADARGELERLVALRLRGRAEPLPFFAAASLEYAVAIDDGADDEQARAKAAKAFWPSDLGPGGRDGDEPHVLRVLAGRDPFLPSFRLVPFGPTFAELAVAVFGPMLRARSER